MFRISLLEVKVKHYIFLILIWKTPQ